MATAVYADIAKQVISLLNAQATTTAYPASAIDIGDDRRNSGELKEAIIESDLEAQVAILETPGNGFRVNYLAVAVLGPITGNPQTAKLPERIGPISRVEIKVNTADTVWIAGEQCPLNEIQEMISNAAVFQGTAHDAAGSPLGGYYFIDEMSDHVTWTGNSIRVHYAAPPTADRVTPGLFSPDVYSPFLVARSLARLLKHGDNPAFMEWYSRQADQLMMLIRKGEIVLPNVEPLIRQAA